MSIVVHTELILRDLDGLRKVEEGMFNDGGTEPDLLNSRCLYSHTPILVGIKIQSPPKGSALTAGCMMCYLRAVHSFDTNSVPNCAAPQGTLLREIVEIAISRMSDKNVYMSI